MDPEHEVDAYEVEEGVMDDGYSNGAADGGIPVACEYSAEPNEYSAEPNEYSAEIEEVDVRFTETDDVNVMDTGTGDVIVMDGEVCSMDTEAIDIGCKDSPPIPDKAARDLREDTDQLRAADQDEYLRKSPEKLNLPKDGSWAKEELKEPAEETAPPIPIKRGNTKRRIEMFEAI